MPEILWHIFLFILDGDVDLVSFSLLFPGKVFTENAPENAVHATPAQLIQSAGLPSSTGYRHVAALEAEGLLRRDATGVYLSGLSAIRTGLAGYGLGHLAPLSQP